MAANIVHVPPGDRHHYQSIDPSYLEDTRLSWKARGILTYLLTKPPDWTIRITDLARKASPERKRDGQLGSIREAMKELITAGYARIIPYRNAQTGQVQGSHYVLQRKDREEHQ